MGTSHLSGERALVEVDHWITTREAAEISGYHVNYVRRLIRRGKIEAEKKGAMWWVDWDSLRAYVEDSQAKDDGRFGPK
jgi:excisionase family DNA binding protein